MLFFITKRPFTKETIIIIIIIIVIIIIIIIPMLQRDELPCIKAKRLLVTHLVTNGGR